MKYIGNKTRLIRFIQKSLDDFGLEYSNKKVLDLFTGTGSMTGFFKFYSCEVTSIDNLNCSINEIYRKFYYNEYPVFNELNDIIGSDKIDSVLIYLNSLKGFHGYITENYTVKGEKKRNYFTIENAMKLDAIFDKIKEWESILSADKYRFLNGIAVNAADHISNTAGTYGAYLKIQRRTALKNVVLVKPKLISLGKVTPKLQNIEKFDFNTDYDIVYLDPPYNTRQYAANFNLLENLAIWDKPILYGKSGLRPYEDQKSSFSSKKHVREVFNEMLKKIKSSYIIMSYSSEGLLSVEEIITEFEKYGNVKVYKEKYRRFKTNAWTELNTGLNELLFICEISKGVCK